MVCVDSKTVFEKQRKNTVGLTLVFKSVAFDEFFNSVVECVRGV